MMKRTRLSALLSTAVASVLGLGLASDAKAGLLTLSISDGTTTLTVADNSALDADASIDRVTISGATLTANFTLSFNSTLTTASNQLLAPLDGYSELTRSSALFQRAETSTTTYTITSSQTDFVLPAFNPKVATEVHTGSFLNAAGSSVDFSGYVDTSNTLFGTGTIITPDIPLVTAAGGGLQPFAFVGGPMEFTAASYALTSQSVVVLTPNGELQSQNRIVITAIPEPASLAMVGVGVLGLAGYGVRRRFRTA